MPKTTQMRKAASACKHYEEGGTKRIGWVTNFNLGVKRSSTNVAATSRTCRIQTTRTNRGKGHSIPG